MTPTSLEDRIRSALGDLSLDVPVEKITMRVRRRRLQSAAGLGTTVLMVAAAILLTLARSEPASALWSALPVDAEAELVAQAHDLCSEDRDVSDVGPLPELQFVEQRANGAMAFFGDSTNGLANCFLAKEGGVWTIPTVQPFRWLFIAGGYDRQLGATSVRLVADGGETVAGTLTDEGYFAIWWPEQFTSMGRVEFLTNDGRVVSCLPVRPFSADDGEVHTAPPCET